MQGTKGEFELVSKHIELQNNVIAA